MRIKYLICSIFLVGLVACDEDPVQEFASTYPISGDWNVKEYYDGSTYGPYHIQIFNTAFSKDSIWISNIYDSDIKTKALGASDKSFSVTKSADVNEHVTTVTISNGKIIGSDSVYFDVILYDEDDEVIDQYYTAGKRATGLDGN